MTHQIKKLHSSDVALARALFHYFQESDGEAPATTSDEYMLKLLGRSDFHVFVVQAGDRIIGGLTAYELPMYREEISEMFLYEIDVDAAYRRRGIAAALVNELKKICCEKGIAEMYVGAMEWNEAAKQLYHNTGGFGEKMTWFVYKMEK